MIRLLATAAAALAVTGAAYACSCLPVDLERDLPKADGAVIGSVLEQRTEGERVVLLLRVENTYKGDINDRVEVSTGSNSAACGLNLPVGERVGLLLYREGGRWTSGLCSLVDPADFLALTNVEDNTLPEINWGGYVVGLSVLALLVFLVLRRHRARAARNESVNES